MYIKQTLKAPYLHHVTDHVLKGWELGLAKEERLHLLEKL
jgi:hypothetical protein